MFATYILGRKEERERRKVGCRGEGRTKDLPQMWQMHCELNTTSGSQVLPKRSNKWGPFKNAQSHGSHKAEACSSVDDIQVLYLEWNKSRVKRFLVFYDLDLIANKLSTSPRREGTPNFGRP